MGLSCLNTTPYAREEEETDDPITQDMTDNSEDYSSE